MRFLSKTLFLTLFLSIFCLFFPVSILAATKSGINIADHFSEVGDAVKNIGENGWLYVMGCPGDASKFIEFSKNNPSINFMIRGHYPGQNLTPDVANAWIAALGDIPDENFLNKIVFMPVNEPNDPDDAMEPNQVVTYMNALLDASDKSGLHATRMKILSPVMNVYRLFDNGGKYVQDLGGATFFNKFDGISLNLYGEYVGNTINQNAPGIKRGDFTDYVKQIYGIENKAIYIPETGVKKVNEPVRYRENAAEIQNYFETVGKQKWEGDSRVKMFAIFSYDPLGDKSPWIYSADNVLNAMKNIGNGNSVEKASPVDKQKFTAWRNSVTIKPELFTSCGGGSGGTNVEGIAGKTKSRPNSKPIRLEVQRTIFEKSVEIAGKIKLVNKSNSGNADVLVADGDEYRFENYNTIASQTKQASHLLLPLEAQQQMREPTKEDAQLSGQPTYRVCNVQGKDGKKLDKNLVSTKGGFSFKTPSEYGTGLFFGNFLQAIFVPNQEAQPTEELGKPRPVSEEERNKPLKDCEKPHGVDENDIENRVAPEYQTAVYTAEGAGDFFKKFLCNAPVAGELLCQKMYVDLQPDPFLAGGESYHGEFTGLTTGRVAAKLPIEPHQEDGLVPQNILVEGKEIRGSVQAETETEAQSSTERKIAMPWTGSVRDGFDAELCSYLPLQFCDKNHPKDGVFGKSNPVDVPPNTSNPVTNPIGSVTVPDSLKTLFKEAQELKHVPAGVLAGVAKIEGGHLWGYSADEIQKASEQGGKDQYTYKGHLDPNLKCRINECAAAGPMQFLTDELYLSREYLLNNCPAASSYYGSDPDKKRHWPDVWAENQAEVAKLLVEKKGYPSGYVADVCNVHDSILGVAVKLDKTKQYKADYGSKGYNYSSYCAKATDDWSDENLVRCAAGAYYGSCAPVSGWGGKSYCDAVWEFYKGYK